MSEPVRTCVACRARRPQRALVRLGRRSDGVVVPAVGRHAKGRHAYLCARRVCFCRAVERRALVRALGRRGTGAKRRGTGAPHGRGAAGSVAVRCPAFDELWSQVGAALDHEIQKMKRSGDQSRGPRHDALLQLRRGLREPGRSA
ncbi:MAG: YlxR family protein [Myxococcota bacterium]